MSFERKRLVAKLAKFLSTKKRIQTRILVGIPLFFSVLIRFSAKFAYLFQQTLNLFQQTVFDTKLQI